MNETNDELKQWIADLRGNIPTNCDFCGEPRPFSQLHPEEGGDWACTECIERWILLFNDAKECPAPLAGAPWSDFDGQKTHPHPKTPPDASSEAAK